MAFLKLKKAYHMDKPLSIQLLTAPLDVVAEMNDFDTMEYKFKAKNVGSDFETKEKGSFAIRNNQEFDFVISEALYKSVSLYDKDSIIKILMKKTAFLINTSRGEIVNENDIVEGLNTLKPSLAKSKLFCSVDSAPSGNVPLIVWSTGQDSYSPFQEFNPTTE